MKILFLNACINQIGGIERVTVDVAGGLIKAGYDISILSFARNKDPKETFTYHPGIKISYILDTWKHICFAPFYFSKIRKAVKKIDPDILIYVDTMLFVFIDPFLKGICPRCKKIAWEYFSYILSKGKKKIRPISRNLAVRKADAVVLLTEADKKYLESHNKKRKTKLLVIPNPVREDVLVASKERADSLLKRKKQILFVGRLARQKQVPELVEIWSLVEKNHPQWELVIVGDGDERPLVEERIRKHDLQRVRLIGKTTDVFLYYRESQILVLSSAFEGLPLVLIEGLFFDLPEVSFDCPCGPEEIIEDGKNGFIIKDFDKIRFAEKLSELMGNDKMREEFSVRSKELSRKYLPENILPQWEKLFEKIK